MLDRLLEALERLLRVALLHVHARNLHPRLRQRRLELDRREEVLLRTRDVRHQKPSPQCYSSALRIGQTESKSERALVRPAQVERLGAPGIPRDALLDSLVHECPRARVVRRAERLEREDERAVAVRGVLWELGEWSWQGG